MEWNKMRARRSDFKCAKRNCPQSATATASLTVPIRKRMLGPRPNPKTRNYRIVS
jgi:hypothetical protein